MGKRAWSVPSYGTGPAGVVFGSSGPGQAGVSGVQSIIAVAPVSGSVSTSSAQ